MDYRKRMRRREIPSSVRFITFSCEHRLPLLSNPKIATLFMTSVARVREQSKMRVFAWVIMPEHVHIMCQPAAGATLERSLLSIKMSVARTVLYRWKQLRAPILHRLADEQGVHRFWLKGGGFDRNVRNEAEFTREVNYIHNNPVKRELVRSAVDWQFSSLAWWLGERGTLLDCDDPPMNNWQAWKGFV